MGGLLDGAMRQGRYARIVESYIKHHYDENGHDSKRQTSIIDVCLYYVRYQFTAIPGSKYVPCVCPVIRLQSG